MNTLTKSMSRVAILAVLLSASVWAAPPCSISVTPPVGDPCPQPRPPLSVQTVAGDTTFVTEGKSPLQQSYPYANPPGLNLLPTVYSNNYDGKGVEMPNTLPSTPERPYNLLQADPVVNEIDPTSPTDDLQAVFAKLDAGNIDRSAIQLAIDILEGNPIAGRSYSGFPLLHYNEPEKVQVVKPIYAADGVTVIGGNVDVHQIWFDTHIESDAATIDPGAVLNVPWTITYHIRDLNGAADDFAPDTMYTDDPALSPAGSPPKPGVAMDMTFFPMREGTETVFKIGMAPGKYYNLTYTWGWRNHPPRVQVSENARKKINGETLVQIAADVFGPTPTHSRAEQLYAISQIGDIAPAKRMWNDFNAMQGILAGNNGNHLGQIRPLVADAERAFAQWKNRNQLPDGVAVDPDADYTLLFANNTIYGQPSPSTDPHGGKITWDKFQTRGTELKVTLYNGDHFTHAYVNVDLSGGSRGYENIFQNTIADGGSGAWFTFGRGHWWITAGAPNVGIIDVDPVGPDGTPGMHKVDIILNHDPSRRLRIYQFDLFHHDVGVWSVH